MKLIRPFAITDAALDSSNVYETPPAAYNAGTTYALGDHVSVAGGVSNTTQTVYKSLQGSNTGNTPASSPSFWEAVGTAYSVYSGATSYGDGAIVTDTTNHLLYESLQGSNMGNALTDESYWLELGPSNLWAMFDQKTGTQTSWLEEVQAVIDVTGRMNTVGLLNLSGTSVNITMMDGVTEIHNEDYSLTSTDGIDGWYSWFFDPIVRLRDLVVTGLPNNVDPEVTITVTGGDGDTVLVGQCILGSARQIGDTVYGARVGITDYSRITEDDFGNFQVVRRGYNKRSDLVVWLDAENTDFVYNLLADYRGTPVLIVGADDYSSTFQFGLLKDWNVRLEHVSHSILDLQFQGL